MNIQREHVKMHVFDCERAFDIVLYIMIRHFAQCNDGSRYLVMQIKTFIYSATRFFLEFFQTMESRTFTFK